MMRLLSELSNVEESKPWTDRHSVQDGSETW